MYYRARWYDPKIGRFISEDPIGLAGGINQYSYVGNNPTNGIDPFGLYEIDVHYYLTKYLAQSSGCFGKDQARDIAEGNQTTDEDNDKLPGKGRTLENSMYHALHTGAAPGFGSRHLWWRVRTSGYNLERLGNALHYLQDTFSHEGYPYRHWGHATGGHTPDKTASDVAKTIRMAKFTYGALARFGSEQCRCVPNPWNQNMEEVVRRFSEVKTSHPFRATIDGYVVDEINPKYIDYEALRRKVGILGVDWR